MNKHTPGPWSVSNIGLIEAGPKVIGDVLTGLDNAVDRVGSKAEQKANGRLIATAPELLAALKRAAAIFHKPLVRMHVGSENAFNAQDVFDLDDVIAKAEGRLNDIRQA